MSSPKHIQFAVRMPKGKSERNKQIHGYTLTHTINRTIKTGGQTAISFLEKLISSTHTHTHSYTYIVFTNTNMADALIVYTYSKQISMIFCFVLCFLSVASPITIIITDRN